MKFLFVVKTKKMETLGPMYLAAIVKRAGHWCRIVELPKAEGFARTWKPDIIGYSIMTGDQDKFKALHQSLLPDLDFHGIAGGPHPTFFPEDCTWADEVFRGEAEEYFADMCNVELSTGIDYPWPTRTDFPNMPIRDFIASRGCPHKCAYCFNKRWLELYPDLPKVRLRSVDNLIKEIMVVEPRFVYFQDSCFGVKKDWMEEFCKDYYIYSRRPYHCHLRPTQVTEEMAGMLKKSGCESIRMALETGSDRLRELIGRKHTNNEQVYAAAEHLSKAKVKFMIQNMLGLPTSSIEDDLATLEANINAQPDYAWSSIYVPYPGTELGDLCKEKGWYKGDYSDISDSFFDRSVLEVSEEYREQVYCLQKVFALCVKARYLPKPQDLTEKGLPSLIHAIMRAEGDRILYGGVI